MKGMRMTAYTMKVAIQAHRCRHKCGNRKADTQIKHFTLPNALLISRILFDRSFVLWLTCRCATFITYPKTAGGRRPKPQCGGSLPQLIDFIGAYFGLAYYERNIPRC